MTEDRSPGSSRRGESLPREPQAAYARSGSAIRGAAGSAAAADAAAASAAPVAGPTAGADEPAAREGAVARSQFRLLAERRFAPFFAVQFLGAFNDNVFKQALVILLAWQTTRYTSMSSDTLQNLAQALFILPFLLFSATAGQIADKYEKSRLISVTVAIELAVMALGAAGLVMENLSLLLAALFLGGVQSTLFGPVKYAILPQQLAESELIGGNALVETGTSVAILLGMMAGGWMITQPGWGVAGVGVFTMAISAAGLAVSRAIPAAPAADRALRIDWNPVTSTLQCVRFARERRTVFLSILGISWFWFYGAMFATQFPNLVKNVLAASEGVVTVLLIVFSIGIGAGSLLCERLSGHKIEIGLVPFGAIGMTLFGIDLFFAIPETARPTADAFAFVAGRGHWRLLADLTLIGVFGGFFIVPLFALVQSRTDVERRSRVIAANNIVNSLFIVAAAAAAIALLGAGLTIPQLLLATAIANALVALYIFRLVPEFLMRFMAWLLVHSVYRLRKTGLERIPGHGPAILVCNHVSFVDAVVVTAACPRPIRWVMHHRIFHLPLLSFFFRTVGAIPIASRSEDAALLDRAYEAIDEALARGELVGIFPEGRISTDGEMAEFRPGLRRVLDKRPVPVVPMALSGLWQSLFSRNPRKRAYVPRLFPTIRLTVGDPLVPDAATPEALRHAVLELRGGWR